MNSFPLFVLCLLFACCQPAPKNGTTEVFKPSTSDVMKRLPYWDPSISQTGSQAYTDTFSVGNNPFRIVHHERLYDAVVEKPVAGKWTKLFEFTAGNHDNYDRGLDVNGDGFTDLIHNFKWDSEVYLYHPPTGSFTGTAITSFATNWTLLDKEKNIYCNVQFGKWADGFSELYTFKDMQPYYYYHIEFLPQKSDQDKLEKMLLYKCGNGNRNDTVLMQKIPRQNIEDVWEFDYKKFWEKECRRLLSNVWRSKKKQGWHYVLASSILP